VHDLVSRAAVRRGLDVDRVREAIRTPGRIDDTHVPQTLNGVRADDTIPVRLTLPDGGTRAKTRRERDDPFAVPTVAPIVNPDITRQFAVSVAGEAQEPGETTVLPCARDLPCPR
jgi:hypothetical protein